MKLMTLDRLVSRLNDPYRLDGVVLAHGCFDIVHPGHIRHLRWAKSQGRWLICSVTADRWITKGPDRPWVPDLLRAENLAALEMVDYVVITDAPDAVDLIQRLRPNFYVKGFEYRHRLDSPTVAECAMVAMMGGRVLYSPNDVVYSSTEIGPPGVVIPDFSGLRVHVIGDAIRDVYTQAKCLGAASKSPTLVYERGESQEWVGGAGVVAAHCRAAGAQVTLTTAGETVKERILVEGVKVAEFHRRPTQNPQIGFENLEKGDVVIFADFGHGVFTPASIPDFLEGFVCNGVLCVADSQISGTAWGNILDFKSCNLLFANEREARFALRDQQSDTSVICEEFWFESAKGGTKAAFLKFGARGLSIWTDGGPQGPRAWDIPPYASQPIVDPIGAGDALLAYATLTYAVTKDLEQAGIIGSLAAAIACAHEGNVPVTPTMILKRFA